MRLCFCVLVEGRIEVETKFRIGETDSSVSHSLRCGLRVVSVTDLSAVTTG